VLESLAFVPERRDVHRLVFQLAEKNGTQKQKLNKKSGLTCYDWLLSCLKGYPEISVRQLKNVCGKRTS